MAEAILLRAHGGPEVLRIEPIDVPAPGAGQLRLRQTAAGVNYHDVYVRSGLYRTLALPGIPGLEAVGIVEEIGPDAAGFAVGDRVAYLTSGYGGYASARLLDAALALKLPDAVDDRLAATVLLKGLTAFILAHKVHRIAAGEIVLVHAAAGGVGRLLAQWAAHLGARVIGTAGSAEKAAIARASGCSEVILYREEDFAARVMELSGGHGADVVYDAVGHDTFDGSLAALAMCGHLVNYGQASGRIAPFDIARLAPKSASITRPGYSHYLAAPGARDAAAKVLFDALASGVLRAEAGQAFPLALAVDAHRALEARVAGPLILVA